MINEAIEPFLNGWQEVSSAAQDAVPTVEPNPTFEVVNHFPRIELENRVVVPANMHLRDLVFSVAPTLTAEEIPVPLLGGFRGGTGGPLPGESSSSFSVEGEVSQDAIWDAVTEEKEQWQALISSREWRSTEAHFALCEAKIAAIVERVTSLYKEGDLPLNIKEEEDIRRGFDVYFSDMGRFESNQKRLNHIKKVSECVGNGRSRIWCEIRRYISKAKKAYRGKRHVWGRQVGLRTRWSKEREGPYSGTEPYDARVSRTVSLRRV